jgi:hypothetical protein
MPDQHQDDISDLVAELVYTMPGAAERLEALREEVEQFGSLKEQVGWQRLRQRVEAQRDKWINDLGRKLSRGEEPNQRQIDYDRGWYDACMWLVRHPEISEEHLAQALATAWALRAGVDGYEEMPSSPHL